MTNVVLFVLAGSLIDAVLVLIATVLSWLWISHFFLGVFSTEHPLLASVLDLCGFIALSITSVVLLAKNRRHDNNTHLRPADPRLAHLPGEEAMDLAGWRIALDHLSTRESPSGVKRFLRWQRDRLDALPDGTHVAPAAISRCWWWRPRTIREVWLVTLWLPIVWVILSFLPHCTHVMESLALLLMPARVQIFDVVVTGLEPLPPGPGMPQRLTQSIFQRPPTNLQRTTTSIVSKGILIVRVNETPRTYYRIKAICAGEKPGCGVAADMGAVPEPEIEVPVRGGRAQLSFTQRQVDPKLGLRLWLLSRDGVVLDEVAIEM